MILLFISILSLSIIESKHHNHLSQKNVGNSLDSFFPSQDAQRMDNPSILAPITTQPSPINNLLGPSQNPQTPIDQVVPYTINSIQYPITTKAPLELFKKGVNSGPSKKVINYLSLQVETIFRQELYQLIQSLMNSDQRVMAVFDEKQRFQAQMNFPEDVKAVQVYLSQNQVSQISGQTAQIGMANPLQTGWARGSTMSMAPTTGLGLMNQNTPALWQSKSKPVADSSISNVISLDSLDSGVSTGMNGQNLEESDKDAPVNLGVQSTAEKAMSNPQVEQQFNAMNQPLSQDNPKKDMPQQQKLDYQFLESNFQKQYRSAGTTETGAIVVKTKLDDAQTSNSQDSTKSTSTENTSSTEDEFATEDIADESSANQVEKTDEQKTTSDDETKSDSENKTTSTTEEKNTSTTEEKNTSTSAEEKPKNKMRMHKKSRYQSLFNKFRFNEPAKIPEPIVSKQQILSFLVRSRYHNYGNYLEIAPLLMEYLNHYQPLNLKKALVIILGIQLEYSDVDECNPCFKQTKYKLREMFQQFNINLNAAISSENLFLVSNLDLISINDFMLKGMYNPHSGVLYEPEFIKATFEGLVERTLMEGRWLEKMVQAKLIHQVQNY